MEEGNKKKIVHWLVLSIAMILVLPTIFVLTFLLLGFLGISINAFLFMWLTGKTSLITGIVFGVVVYIVLTIWLCKRNWALSAKIIAIFIVLDIFLSVAFFAYYFYSFMTGPEIG